MKRIPLIKSVMKPFPYTIDVDEPVSRAKDLMAEHGIRHLPVTEKKKLVGVISDRDIRLVTGARPGISAEEDLKVRNVCHLEAYIVELTERLDTVLLRMAAMHIGSAIVVKSDRLVGIFTMTDACRCFAEFLRSHCPAGPDDEVA